MRARAHTHTYTHVHDHTGTHICIFRARYTQEYVVCVYARRREGWAEERDQHILQIIALDSLSHMGGNGLISFGFSREHFISNLHRETIEAVPVNKSVQVLAGLEVYCMLFHAIAILSI